MNSLVEKVRNAGVVGAGGAGFPSYVKIQAQVDVVIANGAECEPLLYKDQTVIQQFSDDLLRGMALLMEQTGASRGVLAVKEKHKDSIAHIKPMLPANIELKLMPNMYPAGDEYELVYEITGNRIPAGGLPKDIGVLVQNVETLVNIARAAEGQPVTRTMVTVHGEVEHPFTAWLPVGMRFADVISLAGAITCDDPVVIDGGAMMGEVVEDLETPISAVSSGLLVLPRDTNLVKRRSETEQQYKRIGKSGCDQCTLCTEMCPRYLLGYPIQPHLVMRSLLTTGEVSETLSVHAQACCECNICTLWACPEQLNPRDICVSTKRDLKANDLWLTPQQLQNQTREVHSMRDYRGVPSQRLTRKLGLAKYDSKTARWKDVAVSPSRVTIPLHQRMGQQPVPVVKTGDLVDEGAVIAAPQGEGMGVPLHASIGGRVTLLDGFIAIDAAN
ncbi:NADH dehydrogenase [Streptosporangium jomthongense]|uniref:4Fe-4S dicluster domain-containing protein n=1 Tax=Marinobacter aromaticivorans TaxID=1494078 RepID=A0ABW2ITP6_9GAMM|nr:4Fe-4S dicluster domain-containing protein [Marinobacter aromaticivorans]GGE61205.1 NADH dehydrogenase [Streptosporangium jomthongense]